MHGQIRLACLQSAGTAGDTAANLAELDSVAAEAVASGAELLVTPELFLTGYDVGDSVTTLAREPLTQQAAEVARRHGIALVVGVPLWTENGLVNAAVFLSDAGQELASYAKVHLFGELDRRRFVAGNEPATVLDYRGVRIAMLICYDVEFPEAVRLPAMREAQLVVTPTAQMTPFAWVAEALIPVRAWENQVYVCYANRIGAERETVYVGNSSIVGPDGGKLASAREERALLIADIDSERVVRAQRENPYLADLRSDLYPLADPSRAYAASATTRANQVFDDFNPHRR